MAGTVGEQIKAQRSRLNLTQTELAEVLGVDQSVVSRYEADECSPKPNNGEAALTFLSWVPAGEALQDEEYRRYLGGRFKSCVPLFRVADLLTAAGLILVEQVEQAVDFRKAARKLNLKTTDDPQALARVVKALTAVGAEINTLLDARLGRR